MTEIEMRELNDWIAEHVMGWEYFDTYLDRPVWLTKDENSPTHSLYSPTLDPAAALQVLERCISEQRKLNAGDSSFFISKDGKDFWLRTVVGNSRNGRHIEGIANTLPLAIAKFAKQLFQSDR